ncbi:HCNGP-like protein-domain-containing protein [Dissophora ornata]|nr:HCNGP-like protein-domain-containing protein [Dissophora ornata]
MNRSKGLVAYGDSDSESSDEDTIMTAAPKQTGSSAASQKTQESEVSSDKDHVLDRPTPQDTISARSIINARSSGADSLNKIASTNLLKQGLASAENTRVDQSPGVEGSVSNALSASGGSFVRSQSGTPLPPDHSAAAEVLNTPTGGRSPQVVQTGRVPIAEEIESARNADIHMSGGDEGEGGVMDQQSRRTALMRLLLRPKPIPGVENFGIPPGPEGVVNPDVQAKMEQFQHVKVTRGIHFNQSLMRNKNFRNPHIYSSLVELAALNEIGSNFEKKEFFDFEGYGPESYATGIAETQKQAAEKLAQQHAMPRSQLQFVSGSTAQAGLTNMTNIGGGIGLGLAGGVPRLQISSLSSSLSTSASASVSSIVQTGAAGSQRPRKSKWDIPQTTDDPASKRTRH